MQLGLTKRTGDAIRILMHLAALPPGTRLTSSELSTAARVSAGITPTLVAALSRAGILDCARGPGGGCALGRDPAEITIAQSIIAIEGSLEPEHCAIDERRCVDRDFPCGLHETWSMTVRDLTASLNSLSLAEALRRDELNRTRPPRHSQPLGGNGARFQRRTP